MTDEKHHIVDIVTRYGLYRKSHRAVEQYYTNTTYQGDQLQASLLLGLLSKYKDVAWNDHVWKARHTDHSSMFYAMTIYDKTDDFGLFIITGHDEDSFIAFVARPVNISSFEPLVIFCDKLIVQFNLSQSDQTIIRLSDNSSH